MVDDAAALWSAVPTAGVLLTDAGPLNEDVSGSSVIAGNQVFAAPSDVTPSAASYPLAVIYDADGSVTDRLFGLGTSDPTQLPEQWRPYLARQTFSQTPPSLTQSSCSTVFALPIPTSSP